MNNKLIATIIGVSISIIVLASVLVPTLDNATVKVDHTQEEGNYVYFATNVLGGETYTIESGKLVYNGTVLGTSAANLLSDNFRGLYYNGTLTMFDYTTAVNYSVSSLTINTDGSYTWVASGTTHNSTADLTWFVGPADKGNYVMASTGSGDIQFNNNSKLYATTNAVLSDGSVQLGNTRYILNGFGTYYDLDTACYTGGAGAWVAADGDITLTTVNNGDGSHTLKSGAINTYAVDDYVADSNNVILYAPLHYYTLEESPYNSLLGVIPVVILAAILIGIVALVQGRRY